MKDKRRPSIHDITTFSLTDANQPNDDKPSLLNHSTTALLSEQKSTVVKEMMIHWTHSKDESVMFFDLRNANFLVSSPNEIASIGLKLQGQNLYTSGTHINSRNLVFQRHPILG